MRQTGVPIIECVQSQCKTEGGRVVQQDCSGYAIPGRTANLGPRPVISRDQIPSA
jgi:hypothetical protein